MKKRILAALLSLCVMGTSALCPATAQAQEAEADAVYAEDGSATENFAGLDAQYHSQEEIREYYKSHPVTGMEVQYRIKPSVTVPYAAGELTEETKQDALNMLNLYRYIAGVPEVSITEEAQNYAQAAALVCAANRKLSHSVSRPEGMDDELYGLAVYGAFNSNIAAMGNQLSNTIKAYMLESNGDPNFGHRRQLLDYYYNGAGFGMAESVSGGYYSATYVDANLREDKVISYPGQNQPLEYFGPGYAWTVIIPGEVDKARVNIKLTDTRTGREWNFNQNTGNYRLDSDGSSACAIFSPDTDYRDGDHFLVEITGIATPIAYEVNMFRFSDVAVPLTSIRFQSREVFPFVGEDHYIERLNYTPENASNKVVTWSSSNPDIAEAVWAGTGVCRILAKNVGTTTITATSEDGGHTADMKVTVKARSTGAELSQTSVTLGVGQSFELEGKTLPKGNMDGVEYKSDYDASVIKVEQTNYGGRVKVTGKAVGETEIHAYPYSSPEIIVTCKVKVVEPVYIKKLQLDVTEKELKKGESIKLNPTFVPSNVTFKELEWSTSDEGIAAVADDGTVTGGYSVGKAVITAKALDGSGQAASCTILRYGQYEKLAAPVVLSSASDKVVLKKVDGCEYSMDKKNWQDSNEFTNLEADHAYTFYIRKKANGYFRAGEASEGRTVKTPVAKCKHKNIIIKNESKATCTKDGYTGDVYCNDCKKTITKGKAVKAAGHDYVTDQKTGNQVCSICGAVKAGSKKPSEEAPKETSRETPAAVTAGYHELKRNQTYKYDLDGDGKKESVQIKAGKWEYDRYYEAYVYVNGKKKLTVKDKYGFYKTGADLITMSKKKVFLHLCTMGDNDDGENAIFRYKNGKMKQCIDLNTLGRHVSLDKTTENKIKLACIYTSSAIGYFTYECNLIYKNGKLVPEKKPCKILDYSATTNSNKPYLTAKDKIRLYKSYHTKQKSFVLKKGQKVKVLNYYSNGKTQMFQVKTTSGKTGWLLAPVDYQELFEEAYGVA